MKKKTTKIDKIDILIIGLKVLIRDKALNFEGECQEFSDQQVQGLEIALKLAEGIKSE